MGFSHLFLYSNVEQEPFIFERLSYAVSHSFGVTHRCKRKLIFAG